MSAAAGDSTARMLRFMPASPSPKPVAKKADEVERLPVSSAHDTNETEPLSPGSDDVEAQSHKRLTPFSITPKL